MSRKARRDLGDSSDGVADATADGFTHSLRRIAGGRSNPTAETGDPSHLGEKLFAFGVKQLAPSEVGVVVGSVDLRVDVVEPAPIGIERLEIGHLIGPDTGGGRATGEFQGRDVLVAAGDQGRDVGQTFQVPKRSEFVSP